MNVFFLSIKDLEKGKYLRKENKNLLKTEFGICDTIALCGKLEKVEKTDYGPRFWINDNSKDEDKLLGVIIGTFNKKVRKDAEKIMENFDKKEGKYVLLYGNPYHAKNKLYVNVNQDNSALLVDEKTYKKFHEMRERSNEHLVSLISKREKIYSKEVVKSKRVIECKDILNFIKKKGKVKIEEIEEEFSKFAEKDKIDEKILEILESGKAYEPKPGIIELIE